jgi:conjugal transfer pilus assembly protein TraB
MQHTVNQQQATIQEEIKQLTEKINDLKNTLYGLQNATQTQATTAAKDPQKESVNKPPKMMGFVHRDYDDSHKKQPDSYVTSGSFARAVLLTGVVADTGTDAAGSPQPILLRLVDEGIFSKGYKTKQIKEAIIIGACYGNISSERASCRLEKLSLMNQDHHIVERPVEGWLIGEDGRPGLKGDIVDKSSDVARMAVLNGILGGISNYFQNQATAGIYPISAISGQSRALVGTDALKAGGASGIGNALQKLAEYAIKRAEQMSPVIIVGSGRVIDVVFKSGFELKDLTSSNDPVKSGTSFVGKHLSQSSSSNHLTNAGSDRGTRAAGYKDGMKSLKDLQLQEGDF